MKFVKAQWKDLSHLYATIEVDYKAEQNRLAEEELKSDAYTLLNFGLGFTFHKFKLGLFARNLLNTEYIPHLSLLKEPGIPNPGRNIALKVSVTI